MTCGLCCLCTTRRPPQSRGHCSPDGRHSLTPSGRCDRQRHSDEVGGPWQSRLGRAPPVALPPAVERTLDFARGDGDIEGQGAPLSSRRDRNSTSLNELLFAGPFLNTVRPREGITYRRWPKVSVLRSHLPVAPWRRKDGVHLSSRWTPCRTPRVARAGPTPRH
jgi:hypothetical protein